MQQSSAQSVADKVRDSLLARDNATGSLGMQVIEVAPGRASVSMSVREDMLNGHQTCNGGLIAALADSAFAFACNSYNELTVASSFSIELLVPARHGDVLTAQCVEQLRANRTGVYDAEVRNQRGERVALFRGRSYTLKGRAVIAQ